MSIIKTKSLQAANFMGIVGQGARWHTAKKISEELNINLSRNGVRNLAARIYYTGENSLSVTITPSFKKALNEGQYKTLQSYEKGLIIDGTEVKIFSEPNGFIQRNSFYQFTKQNPWLVGGHAAAIIAAGLGYNLSADIKEGADSFLQWYADWNNANMINPWLGAAIKFAIGGTYGKTLGDRIREGKWDTNPKKLGCEFLYWAPMGAVILGTFKIFGGGMETLSKALPILNIKTFDLPLLKAFTTSYAINTLFYPHLVNVHGYYDKYAAEGDKSFSGFMKFLWGAAIHKYWDKEFQKDWRPVGHRFWNIYHTITFSLPKEFMRIGWAALGCVFLGIDMGLRARSGKHWTGGK